MNVLAKRLAVRLKAARGDLPLRVYARRLGISKSSLNALEQAQQNITLATIAKICERLKCHPGYLLDPDDPQ
jgi:DNA-binding Xre family transcriptional regulator